MVSVPFQQHLNRHTQISRGLPRTGSALHHPRRRGVSEDVGRHIGPETGIRDNVSERLFDRLHRLPIPLHRGTLPSPFPATQARQQLTVERHWRLPLIRLPPPRLAPPKNTPSHIPSTPTLGPPHL